MFPINFAAVAVAAVSAFVLGFLFHGPLFGKLWMRLADIHPTGNEKFSDMLPQFFWNFVANFVTAFVLAGILWMSSLSMGVITWQRGAFVAVWLWFGFMVTSSSMEVIWMGRKMKLWLFESAASLVIMAVMGAIIAAW
ncbi:MAG: DUF1761 domain-containing protein [Candidatus Paceibacterota bacterium]|jgi:hypothetical protein